MLFYAHKLVSRGSIDLRLEKYGQNYLKYMMPQVIHIYLSCCSRSIARAGVSWAIELGPNLLKFSDEVQANDDTLQLNGE